MLPKGLRRKTALAPKALSEGVTRPYTGGSDLRGSVALL